MRNRSIKRKINKKLITFLVALLIALIAFVVEEYQNRDKSKASDAVGDLIYVHSIDVGQGDSTLIESPFGNILIDAGTNESESDLYGYLTNEGIRTIDYCILTHPHEDHIGGADMILESFDVKRVIMTDVEATSYVYERLLTSLENSRAEVLLANVGDIYRMGEVSIAILGPVDLDSETDLNNSSIVSRITYGDVRMLFMGDAEHFSEKRLLNAISAAEFDSDFLKLGHHGSSTSSGKDFMDAVTPYVALISCGENNSYGHPHREIINMLQKREIECFRTDLMGNILFECDGRKIYNISEE